MDDLARAIIRTYRVDEAAARDLIRGVFAGHPRLRARTFRHSLGLLLVMVIAISTPTFLSASLALMLLIGPDLDTGVKLLVAPFAALVGLVGAIASVRPLHRKLRDHAVTRVIHTAWRQQACVRCGYIIGFTAASGARPRCPECDAPAPHLVRPAFFSATPVSPNADATSTLPRES